MAARKPYDPAARLALLKPVLAEMQPGHIVIGDDMAKIVHMTWQNFKTTVIDRDPDFPVESRGGMGVAWKFDAHRVVSHIIASLQRQIDERNKTSARIAHLSGLGPDPSDEGAKGMTALEIKQVMEALTAKTRLQMLQGELVAKAAVQALWDDVFSVMQSETLAFVGVFDSPGLLPLEIREAIMDHQRRLLVRLQDSVVNRIDKLRGSAAA